MSRNSDTSQAYVMGHSEEELERLGRQAKLIDPMTRRFFERAGIRQGMRVLDVGSGAGDVALLAASLVGPTGQVVGTDRSAIALKTARARTEERGLHHVSYLEGDPASMTFEFPFDAAVGRYVLMFQRDPVAMLAAVARHVKPGGIVAFHEPDWAGVRTFPPVPLYEEACRWILEAAERNGADRSMGIKLHATFVAAGLPEPSLGLESLVGGSGDMERIRFIAEIVGTLRESIVRGGVATDEEIDIGTLAERIAAQARANHGAMASRSEIGAWCRLPG